MTTTLTRNNQLLPVEQVQELLRQAKSKGATAAEVSIGASHGFNVQVRMGEVETIEHNRDKGLAITVYFGQRKGSASTSDTSEEALQNTLNAACHIARFTNEDSYSGLADASLLARNYPDLDLYHPWDLTIEQAVSTAKAVEAQGLQLDKRITNSEGVNISTSSSQHIYANTHGFVGQYSSTYHSMNCSLIAQDASGMQRDYDYTNARDPNDLVSFAVVAKQAAEKTVQRLNARRLATKQAPVIFHADIAGSLLSHFISAIRGGNLYRQSSFLLDQLNKPVFASNVNITEQPHLLKAIGSAPFDSEGVATHPRELVKDGVLQGYVLDSYSARRLGMQTTGNAGGIHNLLIQTSHMNLSELLKAMDTGLLVTELLGQGVNIVTGDYSRGAAGFWVEKGEIQYPVHEITIAGNLRDMFKGLVAVGNDINARGTIRTGSIWLDKMMIAGE
jgi:PmbA protein